MKTLCLDSAHRHLVIGLYEDDKLVCGSANQSWKTQSETIFPELIRLMESAGWDSDDLDEVVITNGPGSYTGVRIAMCIAKVLCTRKNIPLYTISTLQLYAGLEENALVILDARSSRVYTGVLSHGAFIEEEHIETLDAIKEKISSKDYHLFGDCGLIEKESESIDFLSNFISLRPFYKRVENIHTLTPRYLKDVDSYKVSS